MWNIKQDGFVKHLQYEKPKTLNSLDEQAINTLIETVKDSAGAQDTRVLLISGNEKAFFSGMDLNYFLNADKPENQKMLSKLVPDMFDTLIDFDKPIVMAVSGMAVGFGVTFCGLADVVIMADNAKLKCPFGAIGAIPEAGATMTFPRLMGHQRALWTLLSNEWISPEQCKEYGLALDVVAPEKLRETASRYAQTLAQFPTDSLTITKSLMLEPYREELKKANRKEIETFVPMLNGPACQEGLAALLEKRQPDFSKF